MDTQNNMKTSENKYALAPVDNAALDWDSELSGESNGFVVLPEGICTIEIMELTRGRYKGSEKLPPCNEAVLKIKATTPNGEAAVFSYRLRLCSSLVWLLRSFFECVGLAEPGQPFQMQWDCIKGRTGRAKIKVRDYTDDNGVKHQINDIDCFLPYIEETS